MNVNSKKNSPNNFISHLSLLKKLCPTHTHSPVSICEFSKPYELLFLEFESFIKLLNVNWKNIHSIILSVTCHCLRNHCPTYTQPLIPICELSKSYESLFFKFKSFIKWLNVNWKKTHSIISSVTCHSLWNLPQLIHIALLSIHNFLKPCELLFLEFESFIIGCECELEKYSLNNFICHLSFFMKLSPTHRHCPYPFINIWNSMSYHFLSLSHS